MAEKRMFTKKVTDSDAFIELPSTSQSLYFHLNQAADDDGFNNQIQVAMMKAHASVDDLKILMMKNFVIRFESGVIVIKHWRMHNTLRRDRYTPTAFQEELAMLNIKENESYTLSDSGCQTVTKRLPQVSIGKDSKEKDTCGAYAPKQIRKKSVFVPPTLEEVTTYCKSRNSSVDPKRFFDYFDAGSWTDSKGNPVKSWKQKLITWETHSDGTPQSGTDDKPKQKPKFQIVRDADGTERAVRIE